MTARRFGPWPKNRGVDAILKGNMEERACALALYIIENRTTVRAAAGRFGVSKSTVHKDLQERLPTFNRTLYLQVKQVLDENKAQRHIRAAWLPGKSTCISTKDPNRQPAFFPGQSDSKHAPYGRLFCLTRQILSSFDCSLQQAPFCATM